MDDVVVEKPIEMLDTGAFRLNVILDEYDFQSFDAAIGLFAELDKQIPPPQHDDATLTGCVLGAILREWIDSQE